MTATSDRDSLPRPYLFHIGRWNVPSYTVMLYVGCVLGVYAGVALGGGAGLDERRVAVATVVLMVPALVGSRLLFVVQHAADYRADPARIWRRAEGGAALFGGLVLALAVSVPLLRVLDLPFLAYWDAGAVTMAAGNVFTRIGCHLTGCCAGRETLGRFGTDLPNRAGVWSRRIPAQLLEAAWALAAVAVAVALTRGWGRSFLDFDGAAFAVIIALYGAGRAVLEGAREGESGRSASSLNVWVAVGLVILGATIGIVGATS